LIREHTVKVKPPRAVYVPFPLGLPLGHPGNSAEQQAVLDLAFSTLDAPSGPVLLEYPDEAAANEDGSPIQASEVDLDDEARNADLATEVTLMRRYWEMRMAATGRTGIGLSKIPPQRFRGVVRFLEAYVADPSADMDGRPADLAVPLFIRNCVEDLRVMYVEARLQTHPGESSRDRQQWLLGSTALGVMIRKLREVMDASDDPKVKAVAFGLAR
jgi:hypothetical protein